MSHFRASAAARDLWIRSIGARWQLHFEIVCNPPHALYSDSYAFSAVLGRVALHVTSQRHDSIADRDRDIVMP